MRDSIEQMRNGVHFIIGTPGRISHMVMNQRINFDLCRYVVLDEADRMLDLIFESEIRTILDSFKVGYLKKRFISIQKQKIFFFGFRNYLFF